MHKKSAIIIILILAGVIVVGALFITRQIGLQSPFVFLDEPQQIVGDDTVPTTLSRDGESMTEIEQQEQDTGSITLADATLLYGKNKITLDLLCQATPQSVTTKLQTVVMIENQSPKEREVTISDRTYLIKGKNFVLAAFNKTGDFTILCDKEIISGRLLVSN